MDNERDISYLAFNVDAVDLSDEDFISESINSFVDTGGRLHSVVPKTTKGTTSGYMVIIEFNRTFI